MKLLDIYNGDTGGAGCIGYERAGLTVERMPFAQGIAALQAGITGFDAVHVQPSCKGYTAGTRALRAQGKVYPREIDRARQALLSLHEDVLWVIENVGGARAALIDPVTLCGSMFKLTATDDDGEKLWLQRHRLFENNFNMAQPACKHPRNMRCGGVYGAARTDKVEAREIRHGGYNPPRHVQEDLMGVPRGQFTRKALKGAVPPAYTKWIGQQMLAALK